MLPHFVPLVVLQTQRAGIYAVKIWDTPITPRPHTASHSPYHSPLATAHPFLFSLILPLQECSIHTILQCGTALTLHYHSEILQQLTLQREDT